MKRQIVKIDEEKCNGCGACAKACHEGAIEMVNGKAKLIRDDYCDGMGDCLPKCPAGAISFEEREAEPYNSDAAAAKRTEGLSNWPVQIKLAPFDAPYYSGKLLVAADCTAFAYEKFHRDFIKGRATLIGCPKLDGLDYSVKLAEIFRRNDISGVTVARMEVPCCGGLEFAVKKAAEACGKDIPIEIVTISPDGKIV